MNEIYLEEGLPLGQGRPTRQAGLLPRADLTPSPALLIERLSPGLPGEPHPGVFEASGPGNDGVGFTRFMLDQSGNFPFLGALAQK
ncbi:MAG: hypothetical protein R6V55_05035 [Desulfovermiculus sp.]